MLAIAAIDALLGIGLGFVLGWPVMQFAMCISSLLRGHRPVPGMTAGGLVVAAGVQAVLAGLVAWGIWSWAPEGSHLLTWVVAGVLGLLGLGSRGPE